jgi:regulator of replication initiation timing
MQVSNPTENVKELNAKIQALIFENKDLKTNLSSVKNANHNLNINVSY